MSLASGPRRTLEDTQPLHVSCCDMLRGFEAWGGEQPSNMGG